MNNLKIALLLFTIITSVNIALAQEIENICHQYIIALKMGKPRNLSLSEMNKILDKVKNYKSE